MNPTLLVTHFHRISNAPNAVPLVRRFILDLAVRGKLVDQNPHDEPASTLMDRIDRAKTHQLVVVGLNRQGTDFTSNGVPHRIPQNWIWVRLGDICSKTGSGSTPRGGKSVYQQNGVPFLRSQNVYDDGLRLDDVAYISPQTHEKMSGTAVQTGDLLLNITGGSIGRCCRVPSGLGRANVSQHVAIIRVAVDGIQGYLHRLILSPYFQSFILSEQTGAGRGGLPKNRMDRIPVALPPLTAPLSHQHCEQRGFSASGRADDQSVAWGIPLSGVRINSAKAATARSMRWPESASNEATRNGAISMIGFITR
jgi:type I restriction enzyme S subunit